MYELTHNGLSARTHTLCTLSRSYHAVLSVFVRTLFQIEKKPRATDYSLR